jgi:outer membrane protein assembly factor BamB
MNLIIRPSRSILTAILPAVALVACAESPSPPGAPRDPADASPASGLEASEDWSIFRGDPALTGVASGGLPDDLALLWSFEAEGAIVSSPVIADGRIFFGSDDGHVYAVEAATGEKAWSFATEDIIEAPPLVHEGVVYIGSSDFHFYALDAATGSLVWKYETDDQILGGANVVRVVGRTRIVVGCYDNRLYCFDAAGGELVWTYETNNYVNGTPAVVDDRIVFGGCDAVLHVVDPARGEAAAKIPLGEECHVAGSVAVADGRVYLGHYGNAFVCVDLDRAEVRWTYTSPRFPFFSSPAIGADRVVFGGRDKQLHCADRADGTPLWTVRTRRKVDGSPVICDDKVVFGSGDGRLYVVGLSDGRELWSYDIGQSIFSSPAVAAGMIVIGANDGRLYAFGAAPAGS